MEGAVAARHNSGLDNMDEGVQMKPGCEALILGGLEGGRGSSEVDARLGIEKSGIYKQ